MIVQARKLQAPFPWFGGKSQVAHIVWERFGNVPNYVEPFFGRTAWRARRGGRWRAGCGEVSAKFFIDTRSQNLATLAYDLWSRLTR